jgi:hypothetical protein
LSVVVDYRFPVITPARFVLRIDARDFRIDIEVIIFDFFFSRILEVVVRPILRLDLLDRAIEETRIGRRKLVCAPIPELKRLR